ncbi:M48 family metalloprotease [Streptosporangium pseudovulgare]|uniref:Peptidase M48 domain-containing protein n=1 Tax=Streptosporangium pseudovulgare TaxID=35765 RepID=A0ABQ2QW97_9ACTN|nr:M48 family metalloprotease [Streptosporangium pseudovulgare]GGP97425.1 hypothetical protein GCM10010140_29350 [Streptosporangium pseudovulgare]
MIHRPDPGEAAGPRHTALGDALFARAARTDLTPMIRYAAAEEAAARAGRRAPARAGNDLEGLTGLAWALHRAAGLPGVLVHIDDELGDNAAAVDTGRCHRTPMVELGSGLLDGPADVLAATLAHEIAHVALGHHDRRRIPWAERTCAVAGTAAAIALVTSQVMFGIAAAVVAAGAHLLGAYWARRQEYAADARGAGLLDEIGLPGASAMSAMLHGLEAHESTAYRRGGWIGATHPTSRQRRRALVLPPRRIRWASIGICRSTGHRVGTAGHRHAHRALGGPRCLPTSWRWLPTLHRPDR